MRSISAAIRNELEASSSGDFPVVFADIYHPDLSTTVRVTSDNQNYILDGFTYAGWSFDLTLPSDGDDQSRAKVSIQNVDSNLVGTLMSLSTPLRVTLTLYVRSQFTDDNPAEEVGSPTPIMWPRRTLYLANIVITDDLISADIIGDDFSVEPYPYARGTRARFPGLYR